MLEVQSLASGAHILWGANWSLYSAKVRPYLLKTGIDFVEINPSHPHFREVIEPQIGYITIPVLEMPTGEFVADSTEIIEALEAGHPETSLVPKNGALAALAWLIHSYGSEGLHKPAMHYRWNTVEENRRYIIEEFTRSFESLEQRDTGQATRGEEFAGRMKAYLPALGVSETTVPMIEESTLDLYHRLNQHFLEYPYILGGLPSIADCGLMAPIYAHLGRDVSSSNELKCEAPALYRWIETMNRAQVLDPELWHVEPAYFDVDSLPDTLMAVLQQICAEYVPEIIGVADVYHQWLKLEPDRPAGTGINLEEEKAAHQFVGEVSHRQRGVEVQRLAMIDCLVQQQRVISVQDRMSGEEAESFRNTMAAAGGAGLVELRLERSMVRREFTYVLV